MTNLQNPKSKKKKISVFQLLNGLILLLIALIMIFPFYYVLIVSFADYSSIAKSSVYLLPTSFDFTVYSVLLKDKSVISAFAITTFVTFVGTLINMLVSIMGGYALSKKRLAGRKFILAYILIPMFFSGGLIPYYLTVKSFGLIGSVFSMIWPLAVNLTYLIIMRSFFTTVPESLEESAKIDGANRFIILFRIVVPTSAPMMATMALFFAVDRWNEWWNAMLFINDRNLWPLQLLLRDMLTNLMQSMAGSVGRQLAQSNLTVYPKSMQMAMVIISALPILILYPFLQKYFNKGIMIGSLKE